MCYASAKFMFKKMRPFQPQEVKSQPPQGHLAGVNPDVRVWPSPPCPCRVHPAHFMVNSSHKYLYLQALTQLILHFVTSSLSKKCLFFQGVQSLVGADFFFLKSIKCYRVLRYNLFMEGGRQEGSGQGRRE